MSLLLLQDTVGAIVRKYLGDFVEFPDIQIILTDEEYLTVNLQWLIGWINSNKTLKGAYKPGVFDCEDMALYLRVRASLHSVKQKASSPKALGFIFTDKHALNFCIGDDQKIMILDTTKAGQNGWYCKKAEDFASFLGLQPGQKNVRIIVI